MKEAKRLSTITYMQNNSISIRDKIECILQEINDRFTGIETGKNALEISGTSLHAHCWWRDSAVLLAFKDKSQADDVCGLLSEWCYHNPITLPIKMKCRCETCEQNNTDWSYKYVVIFSENEQRPPVNELLENCFEHFFDDDYEFMIVKEEQ